MRSKLLAFLMALATDPYSWAALVVIVIFGVLVYYFGMKLKQYLKRKMDGEAPEEIKRGKKQSYPNSIQACD